MRTRFEATTALFAAAIVGAIFGLIVGLMTNPAPAGPHLLPNGRWLIGSIIVGMVAGIAAETIFPMAVYPMVGFIAGGIGGGLALGMFDYGLQGGLVGALIGFALGLKFGPAAKRRGP